MASISRYASGSCLIALGGILAMAWEGSAFLFVPTAKKAWSVKTRSNAVRFVATTADNSAFSEFLEQQRIRDILTSLPTFQQLGKGDVARLIATMEHVQVTKGDTLLSHGEVIDSIYLVDAGTFEAYSDNGNDFFRKFQPGELIGDLELLFTSSGASSVRAVSDNAAVWKIPKQEYLMAIKQQEEVAKDILRQDPSYQLFFEGQSKAISLKKCPLFRKLKADDLDRIIQEMETITVGGNEQVLTQGELGDTMYFVSKGTFEFYQEESGIVVGTCSQDGYFGELALIFNQGRALSVRNANETEAVLWTLQKQDFFDSLLGSSAYESALELIKEKYKIDTFGALLKKLKPSELYDLFVTLNLPKKSPVSAHSTLAVIATGMFLVGLVPCFSVGFSENGWPHFFDLQYFSLSVPATQAMAFAFAIVAFSGSFRLPPNTPLLRRHFFNYATLQVLVCYMMQDSNIVAIDGSRYTFDLMTVNPGYISFWVLLALSNIWTLKLISQAISAPEKGRSTVPFNGQPAPIAISSAFVGFNLIQQIPGCFFTLDEEAYTNIYLPFAQTNFNTWVLSLDVLVLAGTSFFMLAATLLFERKITQNQCSFLGFLAFVPLIESTRNILAEAPIQPEGIAFAQYNNEFFAQFYINQLVGLVYAGAAVHGVVARSRNRLVAK